MPGLEKIHLEDALDDNPQTKSMVALFEQDAQLLKNYIKLLYNRCEQVLNAQRELAAATSNLSQHLRTYEQQVFPLDADPDSVLKSTLREFSSTLDEVSSWQQVCVSQLADGMMFPLSRFIEADLAEIFTMAELFHMSSSELEQAVTKFCKIPRKRDGEKLRQDANEEVYHTTKKFHQMSLHYYANLNALQYKRKVAILEPLLGFLHALKSSFAVGHEALNTPELDTFLSNISTSIQGVHAELGQETQKTVDLIDTIEQQSQHLYYAEPLPDMPYIPPNTGLTQKSGYLFIRTRFAGMMTKWERVYVYTLGSHLMSMGKDEVAGSVVMELDRTVAAQALEQEDRRNIFQISNGKKVVVLQVLNERERDEWIATIHNIAKESFTAKERLGPVKQLSKEKLSKQSSEKLSVSSISLSSNTSLSGEKGTKNDSPPSPPSMEHLLLETPIQFDMFSPADEKDRPRSRDGPPVRINPFDQASSTLSADSSKDKSSPFWEMFAVRFLGTMQVPTDRGEQLVFETIRQIMAARAIHNVFKMCESHMVITHQTLKIVDPSHQAVRASFCLKDISFWTTHKDNNRLLGFITRSKSDSDSLPSFHCHIFEAQLSAEEICTALTTAANIALKALLKLPQDNTSSQTSEEVESNQSTDTNNPTVDSSQNEESTADNVADNSSKIS